MSDDGQANRRNRLSRYRIPSSIVNFVHNIQRRITGRRRVSSASTQTTELQTTELQTLTEQTTPTQVVTSTTSTENVLPNNNLLDIVQSALQQPISDQNEETNNTQENSEVEESPSSPSVSTIHFGLIIEFPEDSESTEDSPSSNEEQQQPSQNSPRRRRILIIFRTQEDTSLSDILNQFFQLYEPRGPPPASEKAVESLPTISLNAEQLKDATCCVCFDDFQSDSSSVISLPCSHLYHKNCLLPWLKEHNTCPVCRYELPVDDEEYEKSRKERMSARNIDENKYFNISADSSEKQLNNTEEPNQVEQCTHTATINEEELAELSDLMETD